MKHPRDIANALPGNGWAVIAGLVGRSEKTVRNAGAGTNAKFPASWFVAVREGCARHGIEVSEEAFGFHGGPRAIGTSPSSAGTHGGDYNGPDQRETVV